MGIPSYFKHVISKYKNILTEYNKSTNVIDNLYIDSQSLIYDAVMGDNVKASPPHLIEKTIIEEVIIKLGNYINEIGPKKRVFIAFDGVAPVAKMHQQRTRRYKGDNEKKIFKELGVEKNDRWNTTALTPGTSFMKDLNDSIKQTFVNAKKYNVGKIIISASDIPGEGEHKIFEYIRQNSAYHKKTTTAVYGLDADLIMLSLNHLRVADHIFLFRETPHFIKSIDSSLIADKNYMINIPEMAKAITIDLNDGKDIVDESQRQRIFDYIFMCFFLGNDFLPHFPALNIRTDGIKRLTIAYKQTVSKFGNLTTENGVIWKNVREFVSILASQEEKFFREEHLIRDKQAKSIRNGRPGEDPVTASLLNIPLKRRHKEEYINPFEAGWRERYYKSLLETERTDNNNMLISTNYIEGLEWTFLYYTSGCPDWTWHYKHDYPPLLIDLKQYIPTFSKTFIKKDMTYPVDPNVQLAYVLPKSCLSLLPNNISTKLLTDRPEWYDDQNISIEFSYCRYFWEGHVKTPRINLNELKDIIDSC